MAFKGKKYEIHYATWGEPSDRPVLFFHGFPGSHHQGRALINHVAPHGIFLIASDRPGYGGTVGLGTAADYLDDLRALLTSLNVSRFDVLGVSGGAPWAHMMASRFSESVSSLNVVCGLATNNRETAPFYSRGQSRALTMRKLLPARAAEAIVAKAIKSFDPKTQIEGLIRLLPPADQAAVREPGVREVLLSSIDAARLQGAKGILFDSALYSSDWLKNHCDPKRLARVPTTYFHGRLDKILDWRMTEWMAARHPHARSFFFENEGHYSLPIRQADAILAEVLKTAERETIT